MSLASYNDLLTAIPNWLRRSDVAAQIPDCITLAEAQMNRELRTTFQLVKWTGALAAEFVGLPSSFRTMRSLRLTSGTGRALYEITPEQMARRKAVPTPLVSEPREFTSIGGQLELYPIPDASYTAQMEYRAGITPLSSTNTTNWILTGYPDAYLYGGLAAASLYVKNDDRAAGFQQQFMRVLGEIQDDLRTSYDRTLWVDAGGMNRSRRGAFNMLTGWG